MRALAILASHKQTGISGQMLATTTAGLTMDPAWEVETIYLADYQIGPDYPGHPNPVLRELEKKLLAADVWIISSPTYLGNMSGQLKNFFDCFRRRFYREDHTGRLFPGKFAGKRYVSLTSCYAGPIKNFIFRASNPPLEQVDKVLLDAGLVKVGEAVQTGTWKMKELPRPRWRS
ncbi:NAD(P)H-dependent oxidoreductase [Limosilactobacillus fermentum]